MKTLEEVMQAARLLQVRGMHHALANRPDRARRAFAASHRLMMNFLSRPL